LALDFSLRELLEAGFPIFGALDWFSQDVYSGSGELGTWCGDERSLEFRVDLTHHVQQSASMPAFKAVEYLGATGSNRKCQVARAAAFLALATALASEAKATGPPEELWHFVGHAEAELKLAAVPVEQELLVLGRLWPVWTLLHRLAVGLAGISAPREVEGGCLILIHAFPTEEIRANTSEALRALEKYFFAPLGVRYPLVVFTDPETATTLPEDFAPFTSAPVVPAVIPEEELTREMSSYSCIGGMDCVAGRMMQSSAHRGVENATQFWSADYLRISRYTAGPLFLHPALDQCRHFLKIDTDFYFTAPLERDPIEMLRQEGARLAYWQIHVQGQRQAGYMHAAVSFLEQRGLEIRNRAFYARGRFEEKAEKLGIPVDEVPEALEAATVVYGCLFGGDVHFFREPLYRDFFRYMDAYQGFESRGWSNQFFLGTAAAAFLFPSQVIRLYVPGRHQESQISVADGNITEFLLGASHGVFR